MSESLVARYQRLRARVAGHKSAIKREREGLRTAAAELEHLEAECRHRGISLVIVPPTTEQAQEPLHSHADRTS